MLLFVGLLMVIVLIGHIEKWQSQYAAADLRLAAQTDLNFEDWENTLQTIVDTQAERRLQANPQATRVAVLMYHHVGALPPHPDAVRVDLTVSAADFEKQLQWLKEAGYQTITTQELSDSFNKGYLLPKKPIVLTFDDGYKDNFDVAVPLLQKYKMVGSFAIITEDVGQVQGDNEYASWDQIKQAYSRGMEIVSHSRHHIDFASSKYSEADKTAEVIGAKQDLKEHLGIDTSVFIYPYGHYTDQAVGILKKAGFTLAFTTKYGFAANVVDHWRMPRIRVHGLESLQTFKKNLSSN